MAPVSSMRTFVCRRETQAFRTASRSPCGTLDSYGQRYIGCHVEGEGGLADGGARGQDEEHSRLEAAGHGVVEGVVASCKTLEVTLFFQ